MNWKTKLPIAGLTLAASVAGSAEQGNAEANYDPPVRIDLNFIFHIDEDLVEQDVFVERSPGSGKVYRPGKGERDLSLQLYAPDVAVPHTPFETDNVGPWSKGKALGISLGRWFSARGKGSYTCQDGEGHLEVGFSSLVPSATYTMWHDFYAWPPTEPFIGTYDLPIGARDGSQSVFHTDERGNAEVVRRFKPCLQLSGEHLAAELAIAWHSDGRTHGPLPGEFSTATHVHMYAGLPKRSGI